MVLAMHMANELLSVPVAAATLALAAALVTAAAVWTRRTLDQERLPLMGVMGAFVFAGQMINFTLPMMPGTSGHLGGGVLLAIVLGPAAGIVTMTAILVVQCLLFQDGGLLALGCNIINMGVVPCLGGWGVYRLLLGPAAQARPWRQYAAAWTACASSVAAGAALVPVEAGLSGVLTIPVAAFLSVMTGVHLVIGLFEGLITFAAVAYLRQVRPAALGLGVADAPGAGPGRKAVLASILLTAALLAGVVSLFASTHPDGLEASCLKHDYGAAGKAVREPSAGVARVTDFQSRWSPMSDYTKRSAPLGELPADDEDVESPAAADAWGSAAGILGTVVTLALVYLAAALLRRRGRILPEHH
jgi:cobalt/nickel transport system permease protein